MSMSGAPFLADERIPINQASRTKPFMATPNIGDGKSLSNLQRKKLKMYRGEAYQNMPMRVVSDGPMISGVHASWRHKLLHFVHHRKVHMGMLILLGIDLLLVIASMMLEVQILHIESHQCEHQVEMCLDVCHDYSKINQTDGCRSMGSPVLCKHFDKTALGRKAHLLEEIEHYCKYSSIAILCVFMLEHLLLMIGQGFSYFTQFVHIFDLSVIGVSFFFEIAPVYDRIGALVIIARLWRFIRLGHGALEYARNEEYQTMMEKMQPFKKNLMEAYNNFKQVNENAPTDSELEDMPDDHYIMETILPPDMTDKHMDQMLEILNQKENREMTVKCMEAIAYYLQHSHH